MRLQARLSEKQLPSIGSINLLNSNRQVNCVALSDTGNLFAVGMADSSIKVFWLNKASLVRSMAIGECNPFQEQDPAQIISQPFTITSNVGLKMQLFADQYEAGMAA